MIKAFEKYIEQNKLFDKEDKLLVGTSGGADSIFLCHLLNKIKANFMIAHCNFQLRGSESDKDQEFVEEFGKKIGVRVLSERFETIKESKAKKGSIQMVARDLRYSWFNETLNKEGGKYILTAHQKNDNLETILLNITRGTGIAGLHGIKPKYGNLIRPLLFVSKDEIIKYLEENNIPFREDSSNINNKYYRNRIRNKVIPELKKINPHLEDTITGLIEKITSVEEILNHYIERFKQNRVIEKGTEVRINLTDIRSEPGALITFYEFLKQLDFTFDQCKSILEGAEKQSGKIFEAKNHIAHKDRNSLILISNSQHQDQEAIITEDIQTLNRKGFSLSFAVLENKSFEINGTKNVAQLDLNKVKYPLTLRKWKEGDFFFPLGMERKKKLSDFFIDRKIPIPKKKEIFVLLSEEQIVWVVGERIDNRFKITSDTKNILKISLEKI